MVGLTLLLTLVSLTSPVSSEGTVDLLLGSSFDAEGIPQPVPISLTDDVSLEHICGDMGLLGAAYSPTGEEALLVGYHGTILHWDGRTMTRVDSNTTRTLHFVAWSPDGTEALMGGEGGSVLVYRDGQVIMEVISDGVQHDGYWAAYHPDGKYALIAGGDSNDGRSIVSRYQDGSLDVIYQRSSSDEFGPGTGVLGSISFAPDGSEALLTGTWLPITIKGGILRYDGSDFEEITLKTGTDIRMVSHDPSGSEILLVGDNGAVFRLITTGVGYLPVRLQTTTDEWLGSISWSESGSAIIAGGGGVAYLYEDGLFNRLTIGSDQDVLALTTSLSRDETLFIVGGGDSPSANGRIISYNGRTFTPISPPGSDTTFRAGTFSPDGLGVFVGGMHNHGSPSGSIATFDTRWNWIDDDISGVGPYEDLVYSETTGNFILVGRNGAVSLFDGTTAKHLDSPISINILAVDSSIDGSLTVAGGTNGVMFTIGTDGDITELEDTVNGTIHIIRAIPGTSRFMVGGSNGLLFTTDGDDHRDQARILGLLEKELGGNSFTIIDIEFHPAGGALFLTDEGVVYLSDPFRTGHPVGNDVSLPEQGLRDIEWLGDAAIITGSEGTLVRFSMETEDFLYVTGGAGNSFHAIAPRSPASGMVVGSDSGSYMLRMDITHLGDLSDIQEELVWPGLLAGFVISYLAFLYLARTKPRKASKTDAVKVSNA